MSVSTSPETLITVKVTFDGNTRRFKLALKEVGPSVFQGKLKELLAIPQTQDVKFERYSDSAASYVTLDPQNSGVYKQLYRAAKAKLKLRIKVTSAAHDPPVVPNDAASERVSIFPPSYSTANVHIIPSTSQSEAASTSTSAVDPAQLDNVVAKAVSSYCSSTEFTSQLRDTVREEVVKHQPDQADLISLTKGTEAPAETTSAVEDLMTSLQNTNIHAAFAIYCNSCNSTIHGVHYHCEECDRGDYDLCEACTTKGVHCYDRTHWLTKRDIIGGKPVVQEINVKGATNSRICNCCVGRFADDQCVVCMDCKDFDLCLSCLRTGDHGHDPRHAFVRAHESMILTKDEEAFLSAGRGIHHAALCDSCDKTIFGVRHKCIDCPDWDYCSNCIKSASQLHPGHRFVPVFDNEAVAPLSKSVPLASVMHSGVYCDGPVCAQYGHGICIRGARYKCAICPDTDFCGTCEASPLNLHNTSHPLIKFKTPIRNVLVTSTDDSNTVMGDVVEPRSQPEKEEPAISTANTATQVQTIADVKPTEEFATPSQEVEKVEEQVEKEQVEEKIVPVEKPVPELRATFFGDAVADGTCFTVGQEFTQTWSMKNTGFSTWPAGVTIRFVGGDYMFLKSEENLLDATVTDSETKPGDIVKFSVGLSATWPPNKPYISYWRLTAPDGRRFGDNIWCSINVTPAPEPTPAKDEVHDEEDRHSETSSSESVDGSAKAESVKDEKEDMESATESLARSQASSQMVFPKLPVESPVHSLEHLPLLAGSDKAEDVPAPLSPASNSSHKTFALSEDGFVEEEIDISSIDSDGFMTDEEYDVLCASDEEFEECERVA
ncbi:hypothetical protein BDD12DRAFT_76259 [Trichophaea hybrida]|nr:hypothetical protein BDD12DRAFT_76259 [Trichophaea hybrida]